MCICVCTCGEAAHILSTAALFITLIRWGQRVRSYSVGAQVLSVKWDVICGRAVFIYIYIYKSGFVADTEPSRWWQAGKWSFRWQLRWSKRCLSQIDNSKQQSRWSLQRPSAERNINHKTDTFTLVGNVMTRQANRNFHQRRALNIWDIKFDDIKANF